MNKEKCCICGELMGNSLHKEEIIGLGKVPCHIKCVKPHKEA